MDAKDFDHWVDTSLSAFEAVIDSLVPANAPACLGEAMRWPSLKSGTTTPCRRRAKAVRWCVQPKASS